MNERRRGRIGGIGWDICSGTDERDEYGDERQETEAGPSDDVVEVGRNEVVCEQGPQISVSVQAPSEEKDGIEVSDQMAAQGRCRTESEEQERQQKRPDLVIRTSCSTSSFVTHVEAADAKLSPFQARVIVQSALVVMALVAFPSFFLLQNVQ